MKAPRMTLQQLKQTKVATINQDIITALQQPGKKKQKIPVGDCKQVQWMWEQLAIWSRLTGIEVIKEYRFHPVRKFRFDFAVPDLKIGIEYEGLMSEKSGHTTLTGYTKDTEKYNLAAAEGWRAIRFTVKNYIQVIEQLEKLISDERNKNM
ncbi:hypothetical protein ACE38W_00590 [Chitinophaga sp. Hz27]|uniref:hypothetical protein n=1 Tax=Chitinophaga sp. Hz27 TaxID=3347169 RepID=UPI0035D697FF